MGGTPVKQVQGRRPSSWSTGVDTGGTYEVAPYSSPSIVLVYEGFGSVKEEGTLLQEARVCFRLPF